MKIKELMKENPIAVGPETPLRDVAIILTEGGFSGLPVIGERLEVLGVVSEADILVKEQGTATRRGGVLGWLLAEEVPDTAKLAARTAGQAMTLPAITIGPEADVSSAARLMTEKGIKRLPVVNPDGTLIGIVTRADLVRAFARPDHEIEREIREDVMQRILWIEAPSVVVSVERGEARLSGRLDRRADAELLEQFVARVPGVVSVHSTVRWSWDDRKLSRDGATTVGSW
ncbi:MAG TPA: CBS domain-containing protein [Gaiella sp.]|jgi:CBS domain-containing protein|nr:CBS domain-containing protein [Gaiella sp.]